jgi:hypothetical protein
VVGVEQEVQDSMLTVGVVARRSGLTAKALRHYDRIGLRRSLDLPRIRYARLPQRGRTATAPPSGT